RSLQNLQEEQEEDKHSGSSGQKGDDTMSKSKTSDEPSDKNKGDQISIVMQQRNNIIQGALTVEEITKKVESSICPKFDQLNRDLSYHIGNLNSRMDNLQSMVGEMVQQIQTVLGDKQVAGEGAKRHVVDLSEITSSSESISQGHNLLNRATRKDFLEPPKLYGLTPTNDMNRRRSISPTRYSISSPVRQSSWQPTSLFSGLGSRNPPKLTPPKRPQE
ncbi:hypothetical protein Ciccas_009191, partial [Cichlidogyrus casuarinus]